MLFFASSHPGPQNAPGLPRLVRQPSCPLFCAASPAKRRFPSSFPKATRTVRSAKFSDSERRARTRVSLLFRTYVRPNRKSPGTAGSSGVFTMTGTFPVRRNAFMPFWTKILSPFVKLHFVQILFFLYQRPMKHLSTTVLEKKTTRRRFAFNIKNPLPYLGFSHYLSRVKMVFSSLTL